MAPHPILRILGGAALLALTAAAPDTFDVRARIGPHPVPPDPQHCGIK
jgi:hypothetical protein